MAKPPPDGVDRYVPREGWSRRRRSRTRSPPPRRRRSPVGRGGRGRDDGRGERMVNGRPRKTQEELDREMEDYWGKEGGNGIATAAVGEVGGDEDVEMVT